MIQEAADLAPCLQPPACFLLEVALGRTCRMFADGRTKNKARDQHQADGVVSIVEVLLPFVTSQRGRLACKGVKWGRLLSCMCNPQAGWRHMLHYWHFKKKKCFALAPMQNTFLQNHSAALLVMLTRPKSLHNPCLVINKCACSCGHTEKNKIKSNPEEN